MKLERLQLLTDQHQLQSRPFSPPLLPLSLPRHLPLCLPFSLTNPCHPPITPSLSSLSPINCLNVPSTCNCTSISIFRPISPNWWWTVWWFAGEDLHKLGRRCCDSNLERHDPEISIIRHSLWRAGSSSRVGSDKGPIWHQQQPSYNHPLPSAYLSLSPQSVSPAFPFPLCPSSSLGLQEVDWCNFKLVPYYLRSAHPQSHCCSMPERMARFRIIFFDHNPQFNAPFYYFNVRFNV